MLTNRSLSGLNKKAIEIIIIILYYFIELINFIKKIVRVSNIYIKQWKEYNDTQIRWKESVFDFC